MFSTLYNTERPQNGSCSYFLFASDFAGATRDLIALNMAFSSLYLVMAWAISSESRATSAHLSWED